MLGNNTLEPSEIAEAHEYPMAELNSSHEPVELNGDNSFPTAA
jgi:hypothetical protein